MQGTIVLGRIFFHVQKRTYLCITETSTVEYGGSLKTGKTMNDAEKERWQLIGVIAVAIGTAIASHFASKK